MTDHGLLSQMEISFRRSDTSELAELISETKFSYGILGPRSVSYQDVTRQ